jgi:hypothetical protein
VLARSQDLASQLSLSVFWTGASRASGDRAVCVLVAWPPFQLLTWILGKRKSGAFGPTPSLLPSSIVNWPPILELPPLEDTLNSSSKL